MPSFLTDGRDLSDRYTPPKPVDIRCSYRSTKPPKDLANPTLAIRGVVISALAPTALQAEQRDSIRQIFGDLVWEPAIKTRTTLAEANTDAQPLTDTRAAEPRAMYELLAQSFLKAVPAP